MFIGHFGLGFAAKRAAPRVPLVVLFAAAQFADLLWPLLVALGIERVRIDPGSTAVTPLDFVSYPYSHSLVFLIIWGIAFASSYRLVTRKHRGFFILFALVVSHWVLDVVTHRPDMPWYRGSARVGLGLWNSMPATLALEVPLFAAGVWIYRGVTDLRDRIGGWALGSLIVFLLAAYVAALFGPPPPSVTALWVTSIAGAILILAWSVWSERHRATRST